MTATEASQGQIAEGLYVPDLLTQGARRYPGRPCVVTDERSLTFREVAARAGRFAGYLRERGHGEGKRVALLTQNEPELFEIRSGAQRAGSVLTPLNYRLTAAELSSILEHCGADLLIVGSGLEGLADQLSVPGRLDLAPARGSSTPASGYGRALAGAPEISSTAGHPAGAIGAISYTSGTTGKPKGVMLSNWALHATMLAMGHEMASGPDAVYMSSNPMFHIGVAVAFSFTYLGGTCLLQRRFGAKDWLRALEAGRFTHAQLVPTMVRDVLELAPPGGGKGRLRRLMYGAAPMPADLARRTFEAWDCELVNGYGSTEAMGISMLPPEDHDPDERPHLLGSVGRSSAGMTWRLLDESGHEVPVGEVGEVTARGPNLMSGYWRNPEATADALRNGWMHTGDLGYRDDDGYLYLVDRAGDKIVTGGENVYPSEIEDVLTGHADVVDAAVFAVPDERWGEAVTAVVIVSDGTELDRSSLLAHCRRRLAGYKVPKRIEAIETLPRTATGKLRRGELRKAWADRDTSDRSGP